MAEPVPTERELQALKVLWQLGPATVREVVDALQKQGTELAYTTVLSLLQVMEQKGFVGHRASGKTYAYYALVEREPTLAGMARSFLDRVFDGAMDEFVLHALDSRRLSAEELARLQALIADARQRNTRTTG